MIKRCLHILLVAAVGVIVALTPGQAANAAGGTVYNTPGDHYVNGRYWKTECEKYSSNVVRCKTSIWGTKVVSVGGQYYNHNGWVFNNQTYLPSPTSLWTNNPLGKSGAWTDSSGRSWKTECNTAATGSGGCRTYLLTTVTSLVNGKATQAKSWVLNNMVNFSSATVRHQTTVPASAPALSGVPVEQPFVVPNPSIGPCKASYYWQGQMTASGERFNTSDLTTAHRTLPFGTKLKVTNLANGKSVVVRVNDRGPYISGRCLDLSRAAMSAVGGTSAGVITVKYQKVG